MKFGRLCHIWSAARPSLVNRVHHSGSYFTLAKYHTIFKIYISYLPCCEQKIFYLINSAQPRHTNISYEVSRNDIWDELWQTHSMWGCQDAKCSNLSFLSAPYCEYLLVSLSGDAGIILQTDQSIFWFRQKATTLLVLW